MTITWCHHAGPAAGPPEVPAWGRTVTPPLGTVNGSARRARGPGATYASRMPQGSVTGSRQSGAGATAAAIDVARLRMTIARLSRWLRRHELAGLTPTQLSALATVDRIGPLRLGDLAAAEGIAPSTLTRLVTVLEERGYVERCPVPGDARASRIVLCSRISSRASWPAGAIVSVLARASPGTGHRST